MPKTPPKPAACRPHPIPLDVMQPQQLAPVLLIPLASASSLSAPPPTPRPAANPNTNRHQTRFDRRCSLLFRDPATSAQGCTNTIGSHLHRLVDGLLYDLGVAGEIKHDRELMCVCMTPYGCMLVCVCVFEWCFSLTLNKLNCSDMTLTLTTYNTKTTKSVTKRSMNKCCKTKFSFFF